MNIKEITNAIMHQEWTFKELEVIAESISMKHSLNNKQLTRQLSIGNKVMWINKNGFKKTGTVQRVAIKNVVVKADGEMGVVWRIPASLLTICKETEAA